MKISRSRIAEFPHLSRREVADQMDKSTLVILPSGADAFGLVALEALSRDRPCLVSHLSGVSQLYREAGFDRWVVDSEAPDAWFEKIREIVGTPETVQQAIVDSRTLFDLINNFSALSMQELIKRMATESTD